jgi:hypothetical protein
MTDFIIAFGLLLVIEGCLYALFPNGMKRVIVAVIDVSPEILRITGLIAALLGLGLVWIIRG